MALIPTNELVAVAWLKAAVPYLGSRVATDLPQDNSSWAASGFTTVSGVSGDPHIELPVSRPLVSVECWGVSPNGGRLPWNLASQQAEQIKAATRGSTGRWVTMPSGYDPARVIQVIPRSEPRRTPNDVGNYAHLQMDVEIWWTP